MAKHQAHDHHHAQLDQAAWEEIAAHIELEGELLLAFVTDTAGWISDLRQPGTSPVRRILDMGSGPGVGTSELARLFPDALVVAVDGSPAMLDRAARRADRLGLDHRVTTHRAEMPGGLGGIDRADLIWASMTLHHIGDEISALRVLGDLLADSGLLALAEFAQPLRVLPDVLDIGRPGLPDRLDRAESEWFAAMRGGGGGGGGGTVPATDLTETVTSAGLEVVGSRLARTRLDAPLSEAARQFVWERFCRFRQQLGQLLDDDDLGALDVLADRNDARSVLHRPDVFIAASRQIVIARRAR